MNIVAQKKLYRVEAKNPGTIRVIITPRRYSVNHQRSIALGNSTWFVVGETPNGLINGSNATFTTVYNFIPESVEVILNGLTQKRIQDFNTSGTTTIILNTSPLSGETITVNYQRST